MAAATSSIDSQARDIEASPLPYRLAGLVFAAVAPALFWVACAAGLGRAAGLTLAASPLALCGAAIALFLGSVCAPIVLRS